MIIDGLRYDFAYYQNNLNEPKRLPLYINQMPVFSRMMEEKPEQTLFFQAYSDPPTVTTQRIKSLTTGNLPSFLEFTDNFDGKEVRFILYDILPRINLTQVQEDNILDHLKQKGKKIIFMGVDIWTRLYPNSFEKAFPFDSYSALDLDSVDTGIISALNPLLEHQNEWDLIICKYSKKYLKFDL